MRCGYSRGYTYIIYIAWFLLVVRLILRIGGFSRFPIICDFFRFPIICDFYDKSVNIVEATSFRQSPIWSEWSDESESFLVWKMHPSGSWIDNRGFLRQMRTCIVNKKYIRLGRSGHVFCSLCLSYAPSPYFARGVFGVILPTSVNIAVVSRITDNPE